MLKSIYYVYLKLLFKHVYTYVCVSQKAIWIVIPQTLSIICTYMHTNIRTYVVIHWSVIYQVGEPQDIPVSVLPPPCIECKPHIIISAFFLKSMNSGDLTQSSCFLRKHLLNEPFPSSTVLCSCNIHRPYTHLDSS